jgi:hypothetical protein
MPPGDKDLEQAQRAAARMHDAAHEALCVKAVLGWNRLMERPRLAPGVALAAKFYFLPTASVQRMPAPIVRTRALIR